MSYEKRQREADEAVRKYLREQYPDAPWEAIYDLRWALQWDLRYGAPSADDMESWQFVYPGFESGCKDMSKLIEVLPVELWYDHDSGCVTEGDPWQNQSNWERECEGHPNDGTGVIGETQFCDGTCREPEYIGPDDMQTIPTIEALFDKELWRYLT